MFLLHEEVIVVFNGFFYIPKIEKLSFHLAHVRILGSMEYRKTINDCFHDNALKNKIKSKKYYAEKISETTGIEIQSQHWGGNRQFSMEGITVEYFPNSIYHGSNEKI